MTKVEYIRASHRRTNRKLLKWLDGIYKKLNSTSRVLGWLWWVLSWIIYAVVSLVSWLAFVVSVFTDLKFTLYYMEYEIDTLSPTEVRPYLLNKQKEYTRRLSYGSVPVKEQRRIDKTFEYLFSKYPAPGEEPAPDIEAEIAAERHTQVIDNITEVKDVMLGVATYTDQKSREDAERKEYEAKQLAEAERRRERHLSKSGFEHNPEDFCPKLSDKQLTILTKYINDIGIFKRDVTTEEIRLILLCEHTEPLQASHNKLLALLLESLSIAYLITPKWQRVAEKKNCFTSKMGKPLTAKDLSSAKQLADIINPKKYDLITDCMDELKKFR